MREHRKTIPLSQWAEITMGQSPDGSSVGAAEKGLPFLQGCAEFGSVSPDPALFCDPPLRVAKKGSALISVRAPVGTLNWADQDYCIGRGLGAVKARGTAANTVFLYYALALDVEFLHQRSQGSTFLAIGSEDLRLFPVPNFEPAKQQKIARVLQTVDQAIEATEALIEKYQQVKAGLMHDLFTRGIGKDGKLRPPRSDAPDLYKESPIGWLPKEWDARRVSDVVRSAEYGISTSLTDNQTGIPVLRMNNIQDGQFDVTDLKYSSDPEAYGLSLRLGDVLYNRTNSMEHVGKTAIWCAEVPECSFASYLVRMNLVAERMLPEFFSYWMNQPSSQTSLRRFATPAVQQVNINPTNVQRVIIGFPDCPEEQPEIVKRIQSVDRRIDREQAGLEKIRKQKTGLMHDLLTGKVEVNVDEPEAAHV